MTKIGVVFCTAILISCVSGDDGMDDGVDCDLSAVVSVSVSVVSTDGTPVDEAVVTYTVDGGEELTADCIDGVCFLGYELAGEFSITASYDWTSNDGCCWANDSETQVVTVIKGECHVETQSVTIALDTDVTCVDQGDTGDCLP